MKRIFSIRNLIIVMVIMMVVTITIVLIRNYQYNQKAAMKADTLTGTPSCTLFCWNGITPGTTTREQGLKILRKVPYILHSSIDPSDDEVQGGYMWTWIWGGRRIQSGLYWEKGVIQELSFDTSFDMTVHDVVNKYGPPEALTFVKGGIPEQWDYIVQMYYPKHGVQVMAYTSDFSSEIEPSTEIGGMMLFAPTSLEARLKNFFKGISDEQIMGMVEQWKGYGDIEKLYYNDKSK